MAQTDTIETPETVAHLQPADDFWLPPNEDELPYDDGEPMESARHHAQMDLLIETLQAYDSEQRLFVGGNMFLYYRASREGRNEFIGPDLFVVCDAEQRERKSWVVWGEGKGPDLVIELLSESTATIDRTTKKALYQNTLRVPEYFYYDPFSGELAGFALLNGVYEPIQPDDEGRLVSQRLQLALVRWQGTFSRITAAWLRWATLDGQLLLNEGEQERQRAEQERQRAEAERQRADELAALVARYREQFGPLDEAS